MQSRLFLAHHSGHEVALGHDRDVGIEAQTNLRRIRAGRNDEVVFETAVARVVDEVDAGIDVAAAHLAVKRDVSAPLLRIATLEVVDTARLGVDALDRRRFVRTDK